jgi:hypothetical protein
VNLEVTLLAKQVFGYCPISIVSSKERTGRRERRHSGSTKYPTQRELEFRSEGFLDNLRDILKDTRLNPRYLELELTETVLMQHAESTLSVLSALKAIGVRLAVDDFGTGYSRLSYLKRFPIDSLKIDQSFVRDISNGTDDVPIVRAVITMAKSLKQRVVGEGVETEEQMAFLQAPSSDEVQGYYFNMPLAAEHFAKLLKPGSASFIPAPPLEKCSYNLDLAHSYQKASVAELRQTRRYPWKIIQD